MFARAADQPREDCHGDRSLQPAARGSNKIQPDTVFVTPTCYESLANHWQILEISGERRGAVSECDGGRVGSRFHRPFDLADAAEMLGAGSSHWYVWIFGLGICTATVLLRYHQIARVSRWLAVALFAYVVTAFLVHPNWAVVMHDTFSPHWPHGSLAWAMLVAILGTTISPYLFFWQAGQEVEEEKAKGRRLHGMT